MKPTRRPTHLFPRRIDEVVKAATQPLMDSQGKLYGALLRDWREIVGAERAADLRPKKLHWPGKDASGAVLHLDARAARAPELVYESELMLEQCARYFGYRAIARIVIHPSHEFPSPPAPPPLPASEPAAAPKDMAEILRRMRERISADDKRDQTR